MTIKITDRILNKKSLQALIMEAVAEILSDPDFSLQLSQKAQTRLKNAEKDNVIVSAEEIKRKYY